MVNYWIFIVLTAATNFCLAQNGYNYQAPPTSFGPVFPSTVSFPSRPNPQADAPIFGTTAGTISLPTQPPYIGGLPTRPISQGDAPITPVFPSPGIGSGVRPGIAAIRPQLDVATSPGFQAPGFGGRPVGVSPIRPGSFQGSRPVGGNGVALFNDGAYEGGDYSAIPGEPGIDYPVYAEIPRTSFDCNQQQYPGYYADVEAQCQVFHVCSMNRTYDFLCPNGTIFSQESLVCVWWNQFDCASAPALYMNNAFIYDYSQTGQHSQRPVVGGNVGSFPPSQTIGTQRPTNTAFPQRPQSTGPISGGGRPIATRPTGPAVYPQGPTGPTAGYPSAVGGYSDAGTPSGSGFPSGVTNRPSGFLNNGQADIPFQSTINPQQSPNREYLPPRRN